MIYFLPILGGLGAAGLFCGGASPSASAGLFLLTGSGTEPGGGFSLCYQNERKQNHIHECENI
jgi:hypothetical protein